MLAAFAAIVGTTILSSFRGGNQMPRKGHVFSAKEHRQAEHIAESEEQRGMSPTEAKSVGFATVVKHGGGNLHLSAKEKRQAQHIAESKEDRGMPPAEAKSIGYATMMAHKGKRGRSKG
jgi:hypothetical protein